MDLGMLLEMASSGNIGVEFIERYISSGANLNEKTSEGLTLLHVVAERGLIKVAELLISNGANVNAKSNNGNTPLHQAIAESRTEMVRFLVSKGADVNAKGEDDWTPLHWAAQENHNVEIVKILASAGWVNFLARTSKGSTALEMARQFGNTAIVESISNAEYEIHTRHVEQVRQEREERERRNPEERERREAEERRQHKIATTKKRRAIIGVVSQIAVTAAYLFVLFGTNIVSALWLEGGFVRLLPLAGFSLVVGIMSIVFLRGAGYGSGLFILIGMVLVQSIAASVWTGNVGFLFFNLIGRAVLNALSAIPGAILAWKETP